jgi:hypothetical protein
MEERRDKPRIGGVLMQRSLLSSFVLAIIMISTCMPALAQGDNNSQARLDLLLKRIEELEASQKRMQDTIEQLKVATVPAAAIVASAPAAPAPTAVAPAPEPVPADDSSQAGMHTLGPVQFSGFTDFSYGRAVFENLPAGGLAGTANGFGIGDFDLFTNTRIAEKWSLLAEVLVTSDFTNQN